MPTAEPATELEPVTSTATSTLDEFLLREDQNDAIVSIILTEWAKSEDAYDADCAQGYLPSRSYLEVTRSFNKVLRNFNWQRLPFLGQERWQNDVDFSRPVQIVYSSVTKKGGQYHLANKGTASLDHTGQLALLYEDLPALVSDKDKYWILVEFTSSYVPQIKIMVASGQLSGRTRMVINDSRVLYEGDLVTMATPSDLPGEVPATVVITEVESVMR